MITGNDMARRLAALALAFLLFFCGCSEDEENPFRPQGEADIPDSALPFPDTPDKLMANFLTIYETRDVDEYLLTLDPAFKTILQQETTDGFQQVGEDLDVAEETRIHTRLFSGMLLEDEGGNPLPPVLGISFDVLDKTIDWGQSLGGDPIPKTLSALYQVDISIDRGPSYSMLKVRGNIRFYVAEAAGRLDGQTKTYFRLVGQLDMTRNGKVLEEISWGSLKALFYLSPKRGNDHE